MRRSALLPLLLTACDLGGWRVLDTETGTRLEGVHVVGLDRVLAAGDRGTIVEWDGTEITTTSTDADVGARFPGFYGVAQRGSALFVAGDQGTVLNRPVPGADFEAEDSQSFDRLLMMMAATPTILYAAGENGRVIRRGNRRWEAINIGVGDAKVTGGWAISDRAIAFTTDRGFVIDKVGNDWVGTQIGTGTTSLPLFDVWSSTVGADTYAVGLAGSVFKRAAGSDTFLPEAIPPKVTQDLYGIYGISPDEIYAVGARGTILRFDGVEWKGVPSGTSADLYDIHASPDGKLIAAAGNRGIIVVLEPESSAE